MTDAAQISMRLPANTRFVATARVATASLAAELDYNLDQIEDLRVGVNELVSLLVEWSEDHKGGAIDLTWRLGHDTLEIEGRTEVDVGGGDDALLDQLTGQILAGVVDDYEIGAGWGRIVKRRTST